MKTLEELGISPMPWEYSKEIGAILCDAHGVVYDEQMLSSDGRIIAAAPELYEALAAVVSWYEKNKPLPYEENGIQMIMHYAKNAIAKAGGETNTK